jgi:hypothetical protein
MFLLDAIEARIANRPKLFDGEGSAMIAQEGVTTRSVQNCTLRVPRTI